jgi:HD-GYP domain-containing protein (c-di-GMP phosphodiesterase class II)
MEQSQHYYVRHLAEVNKINRVVIAADVFNSRGILVVKKGTEVDKVFAQKLAKHKLVKPLDQSISLAILLNQRTCLEFLIRCLEDMSLSYVARKSGLLGEASEVFHLLTQYPLITMKLTVLSERMPEVFSRSLITSVLALSLCRELKLSAQTAEHVFIANVIADVGLLHIDPFVVNKKGKYSQDEWKLMQGHVIIAKHFADMVPNLSKKIGKAILEHHERADGFGYPFAKHLSQLGVEGQILAIVGKVIALADKLVIRGPHSWTSVIAVMQIPSTAHGSRVHDGMMRLLKRLPFKYEAAFSGLQFTLLVALCIEKRERLELWFKKFARIYVDHKSLMTDTEHFRPLSMLHKLEHTKDDTGVLNFAQDTWLTNLPTQLSVSDFLDIEEFALVLDEVEYQCLFVMRELVSGKDYLAKRFNGIELPYLYYRDLMNILAPEEAN